MAASGEPLQGIKIVRLAEVQAHSDLLRKHKERNIFIPCTCVYLVIVSLLSETNTILIISKTIKHISDWDFYGHVV